MSLIASHDGKYFFIVDLLGNKIVQRSISSGDVIRVFSVDDLEMPTFALTNDGKHMVSGSLNGTVRVWDVQSATVLQTFPKANSLFAKVDITADGKYIVSSWMNSGVEVRELHSGKVVCQIDKSNFSHLSTFQIAGNDAYLIESNRNELIVVWDMLKGEKLYVLDNKKYINSNAMTVSANASFIFFALDDDTLSVWDIAKREECHHFKLLNNDIERISCTISGKYLLASNYWVVEMWDTKTQQLLYHKTGEMSGSFTLVNQTPFIIYNNMLGATLCNMQEDEQLWSIKYEDNENVACVTARQTEMEFNTEPWVQKLWDWADEQEIPKEILPRTQYDLLKLEELDLEEGLEYEIVSIPKEIGYLSNLTFLSFITESDIPKEIGLLYNLKSLSISVYSEKEFLVELPDGIENLTKLSRIFLSGNISASSIERLLKNNTDIDTLYISSNDSLTNIPESIFPSASLETLRLLYNDNLLLSPKQLSWACKLRDEEEKEIKMYATSTPDGTDICYEINYGNRFQYYSIIPYGCI